MNEELRFEDRGKCILLALSFGKWVKVTKSCMNNITWIFYLNG